MQEVCQELTNKNQDTRQHFLANQRLFSEVVPHLLYSSHDLALECTLTQYFRLHDARLKTM